MGGGVCSNGGGEEGEENYVEIILKIQKAMAILVLIKNSSRLGQIPTKACLEYTKFIESSNLRVTFVSQLRSSKTTVKPLVALVRRSSLQID